MTIHIPFLAIQLFLMALTIIGCVAVYAYLLQLKRSIYICYSCKHFSQTYMKPVQTTKWLGKEEPLICRECGTDYTYKYLKIFRRYPRYYRIPGFERVKTQFDDE